MCIEFRLNIVLSLHLDGVCRFLSSRLRIRGIAQFLAFFHFRQKMGGGGGKKWEKKEKKALKLLRSFTAPPNRYHVRSIIGEKCASIIYKRVWNVFQRTRGCEMVELMHRFSSLPSTSSTAVFFDQISSRFTSVLFFFFPLLRYISILLQYPLQQPYYIGARSIKLWKKNIFLAQPL